MDLKKLTDNELDLSFKKHVRFEHSALVAVLEHICEAISRKTFSRQKPLLSYLTKDLKYSRAAAQSRIDAARLLNEFPMIGPAIIERELCLTQLGDVAKGVRLAGNVSHEKKAEILEFIKGKEIAESQIEIAKALGIKAITKEKKRYQEDGSVRIETTFSAEQEELFQKTKEAMSHTNPSPTVADAFEFLAKKFFKPAQKRKAHEDHVPKHVHQDLRDKQDGCQWVDPLTKEKCGSHFMTQTDHKQSRWAGGSSDPNNLQLLCRFHNKLKFELEMEAYFGQRTL